MPAIDTAALAARLAAGDVGNTAQKGEALEAVVSDTFCQIDGVGLIRRNIEDNAGSIEIDILLYNLKHPGGLPYLPSHLVIECKNWQNPVDSATLTVFAAKLRRFRVDFGILVAANGITGDPQDKTAAHAHLRYVYERDGMIIVVVTRAELESLIDTAELEALIRDKYGLSIMGAHEF